VYQQGNTTGKKVLGAWEGSTENKEVSKDLLNNLTERGLKPEDVKLVILDGGKAINGAVRDKFGEHVFIQRCQIHKIRNVLAYLPEEMQASVRMAMKQAYKCGDYKTAKQMLTNLGNRLRKDNEKAANSLAEGQEETLTLLRLQASKILAKSLSTTNLIENLNGTIRRVTGRVKRWRNPNMVIRWVYTGINEAERGFRRINGYRDIGKLLTAIDYEIKKKKKLLTERRRSPRILLGDAIHFQQWMGHCRR
jgi:putative transposase